MKFSKVVTGVDIAMSSNVGSDYAVYTTWGIDEKDHMYLMHIYRAKGKKYQEQISELRRINSDFRPDIFVVENNAAQNFIVNGLEEAGLPVLAEHTGTNKYNLEAGLPALALMFEKGKIHLPIGDEYSKDMTSIITGEF